MARRVRLVDVLITATSGGDGGIRLPTTAILVADTDDQDLGADTVLPPRVPATAHLVLPRTPWRMWIHLSQPLADDELRQRLWNKYAGTPADNGLKKRAKRLPDLLPPLAYWRPMWRRQEKRPVQRRDEDREEAAMRALVDEIEAEEAGEADFDNLMPGNVPDGFAVVGGAPTDGVYELSFTNVHAFEFVASWVFHHGCATGLDSKAEIKDAAQPPGTPPRYRALLLVRPGAIERRAGATGLAAWPAKMPLAAYWLEQMPLGLTPTMEWELGGSKGKLRLASTRVYDADYNDTARYLNTSSYSERVNKALKATLRVLPDSAAGFYDRCKAAVDAFLPPPGRYSDRVPTDTALAQLARAYSSASLEPRFKAAAALAAKRPAPAAASSIPAPAAKRMRIEDFFMAKDHHH